jgi:1-acyl-sn-glycerol-3-phosphate acyltransferase
MNAEVTEPAAPQAGQPETGLARLRGNLRAGYRLTAMGMWTVPCVFLRLCARPLVLVSVGAERRARRGLMKFWASGALRILNVRLTVEGQPPKDQFFIVSNHQSYLDIVLFAQQLGCVFVAMHEMADWPLVGFVTRAMNTIFINRAHWREVQVVNESVGAALDQGQSVLLFPESTTSFGHDLLPFRAALLEAPIAANIPVQLAALQYHRTNACPDPEHDVCWVDEVPFAVHAMDLLRVPRVDATLVFGASPLTALDRKALARALEESIRAILPPRNEIPADPRSAVS